MVGTIFTAVAAFIATGFDELVVLTILFVHAKENKSIKDVYLGQQIGMIVLLFISLLAVCGITLIPHKWVGLLGILPLFQGIRILIHGNEDEEDEDILQKTRKFNHLMISVAFIAIAGGGEEIAIYIPYFASLTITNLILTLIVFNVLVPVWCTFCRRISSIKHIQEIVEKYERILVPVVFIGLGIFVLLENKTVSAIINLFH